MARRKVTAPAPSAETVFAREWARSGVRGISEADLAYYENDPTEMVGDLTFEMMCHFKPEVRHGEDFDGMREWYIEDACGAVYNAIQYERERRIADAKEAAEWAATVASWKVN